VGSTLWTTWWPVTGEIISQFFCEYSVLPSR
jgi:hypothetical protein